MIRQVRKIATSLLIFSILGLSPAVHGESAAIAENLPLDVQVDLLMTELSRLLKVDDNQGIIELIPRIRSLDIEIPDALYFLEARALFRTGDALGARDRLVVYLANTGRDGRSVSLEIVVNPASTERIRTTDWVPGPLAR